jgi:tetratricopeptide (TPR) repeat protein
MVLAALRSDRAAAIFASRSERVIPSGWWIIQPSTVVDEAIRLDPNNAVAYTNRGRVYERQGRFDEATVEHDAAIRLNPALAIAYANRGLSYEGKRDYEKALADFERALSIDPKLVRAIEGRDRVQASHVTAR